jgi:hypothetical protein
MLLRVDGEVLRCTHGGEVTVRFPGFTDAQNAEVAALVKQLAPGTLTESDQARIQQRIDALAWTGVALLVVAALGMFVLFRR